MKNDFYKTVKINHFEGIKCAHEKTVKSTLYKGIDKVFIELKYSNFLNMVDWKSAEDIKNKETRELISLSCNKTQSKFWKEKVYPLFIEMFLAKFLFSNDLPLTIDAIRLFQADFLGWKDHEIT